jgi:hypothetical protein
MEQKRHDEDFNCQAMELVSFEICEIAFLINWCRDARRHDGARL